MLGGAILQQAFPVEFTVGSKCCDDCMRIEAKDYWRALVQVRQKAAHKKTLFFLEQLVLKHKAHAKATGIKQVLGGMDFYFARQNDARRLVDFLMGALPCRYHTAKELVSQDDHNNTYDYKHTFALEIVPICKVTSTPFLPCLSPHVGLVEDNVVCLSKGLAQSLGNLGQICVCIRVSEAICLIDPATGQR